MVSLKHSPRHRICQGQLSCELQTPLLKTLACTSVFMIPLVGWMAKGHLFFPRMFKLAVSILASVPLDIFFIWYNSNYNDNDSRVGITEPLDMGIMGLLPDTQNCGCTCAGNAGNVFPVTAGKWSRHASRHVRHARAVMHAGIAN